MTAPIVELREVAASEANLLSSLEGLTDEVAGEPSALPGWTRAEVITHLARNADGFRGMAEAALRGEVVDQYPGGPDQRSADIAAGRGRPAAELVGDVSRSISWLHETWASVPDEAWDRIGRTSSGDRRLWETVAARWREVEVHHVDLALEYRPSAWPDLFVRRWLAPTVTSMPDRAFEPPDGRWVVWAEDLEQAWVVTPSSVEPFHGGDADAIVRGPGSQVLAWLLGRQADALVITGDRDIAVALPSFFPFG